MVIVILKVGHPTISRDVGDSVFYHSLSGLASGHSGRWPRPATIRSLGCSRKMRPLGFLDPSAFIATSPEPPTLVSECDFFVQFWRTRKGPNQFADAMRDAE
jgi:hypothetical protein